MNNDTLSDCTPQHEMTFYMSRTLGNKQNFTLGRTFFIPEVDDLEHLDGLLKLTWNIFGVSSMYGFDATSDLQLKLYAKRLREEIASNLTQEDVSYETKFTIVDDIDPRPLESDPPPISIEVDAISDGNRELKKSIYRGLLISWRTDIGEPGIFKCTNMPLLLCRGAQSTMKAVHQTLCHMFDCIITTVKATEDDLKWIVPIVLTAEESQTRETMKGDLKLEYTVPDLPVTETITVKFSVSDVSEMWKTISEDKIKENDAITDELIEIFYEKLKRHFEEESKLQLETLLLHKISLPSITIMENKMKISNRQTMHRLLMYLNEKCVNVLHTLRSNELSNEL